MHVTASSTPSAQAERPAPAGPLEPVVGPLRAGKPRIRSASVLPRYRFHEECQRLQKTLKSWGTAPGVSQTDHDEVVRWDDQRDLSTQAGHVVCLPGYRKIASAVYPKEGPVHGAPVSLPCRGHRAHDFDVDFMQYLLTVPHSILEMA